MSEGSPRAERRTGARRRPRWLALAARVLLVLLALAAAALFVAWRAARASLPILEGTHALRGLSAEVVVERDGLGVPTVTGRTREDVARATGFLHAQDRFFQMDLARRFAAGELSALVGKAALPVDRALRVHRFRAVAREALSRMDGQDRRLLDAYVGGVNQGLAALGARPPEYLLLRAQPEPWRAEDALLVVAYMYYGLQEGAIARESLVGVMRDTLPPSLVAFLMPQPDEWEAPIAGTPPAPAPLPAPAQVNLRASSATAPPLARRRPPVALEEEALPGSNNWAVDAAHAAGGQALLANDMHLDASVPNIWYRMSLRWPDRAAPGGTRRVTGVTLPGVPAVVAGSNGQVAWGFTNAMIESSDLVVLEPDPSAPGAYKTPSGPAVPVLHQERIACKGADDEVRRVEETIWGPIVDIDHHRKRRALAWVAQRADSFNLVLLRMESAGHVGEALDVGSRSGMPAQNLVVADAQGHIGWTISGAVPNRVGFDGTFPVSWADGSRRWDGLLPASAHPRIVDPPGGRLWTANNQAVYGLSTGIYSPLAVDEGARAKQIRDGLLSLPAASERDLLRIQLDDRAVFFERWRALLLRVLAGEGAASTAERREFQRLARDTWTGRASPDSVAYTLVTRWRRAVADAVFHALTLPCREASPSFDWLRPSRGTPVPLPPFPTRIEAPLWRLVSERPLHLLAPRYRDWDDLLLASVDTVILAAKDEGERLSQLRWGGVNSRIRHPLSGGVGPLRSWLDMEDVPLAGGANVPRQRVGTLTASERLVVAPGRENTALFHMPGGQSGHPLSPHYRDGHMAWVRGEPTPLLPGSAVHRLVLTP